MAISVIFDEEKFVKEILDGHHNYLAPSTVSRYLVRKYYKNFLFKKDNSLVLDLNKLKFYIIEEMEALFNLEELTKNMKQINKNIKKYSKSEYDLKKIDGLKVSKNELNKISGLNNKHLESLAFSILILRKIYNFKINSESNFFNMEFKDYYKSMTGDKGCMKRQNGSLRNLEKNGMIKFPDKKDMGENKGFELLYIDFDIDNYEILIDDVRTIPLIYAKWKGDSISNCEECNKLFEANSNRSKYCDECAKEIHNERNKKNMRKSRID